ncbi:MAG: NUDIX hydrolase [Dehalococcoidia bacterium]|nr:NUDIX hydrolase [Dehalococcoidia bacterium]
MTYDPFSPRTKRKPTAMHPQVVAASGRSFACFPVSVLAFVVDTRDRCLLLRRPGQPGWEVFADPLQEGESVQEAVVRGLREKAGPELQAVYLGVLDTFTLAFDAQLPPAVNVCCLMRYLGGRIDLKADLLEAEARWWDLTELDQIDLATPRGRWDLLSKAGDMSRYLRDARQAEESYRQDKEEWEQEDEWK